MKDFVTEHDALGHPTLNSEEPTDIIVDASLVPLRLDGLRYERLGFDSEH